MAEKSYWDKINEGIQFNKSTSEELHKEILEKLRVQYAWIFDKWNQDMIHDLCLYFSGDSRFEEKDNRKLHKGLLIYGGIGCGKTTLMKVFMENQVASYMVKDCTVISEEYQKNGVSHIQQYVSLFSNGLIGRKYGHTDTLGLCFDDLGIEDDKKHFGNENNVMRDIITKRYFNLDKLKGKTHITTNLTMDEIEKFYGKRVRSRLRQMCNLLAFPVDAPDRRN